MRKVVIVPETTEVRVETVRFGEPIFAYKDGKLKGMVLCERGKWILRLGGESASNGWHYSLKDCVESNLKYGYTFFLED